MSQILKPSAAMRSFLAAAIICLGLFNALEVASCGRLELSGKAELLPQLGVAPPVAEITRILELGDIFCVAGPAGIPSYSKPPEYIAPDRFSVRPAADSLPILFPSRHPSLSRPPPAA